MEHNGCLRSFKVIGRSVIPGLVTTLAACLHVYSFTFICNYALFDTILLSLCFLCCYQVLFCFIKLGGGAGSVFLPHPLLVAVCLNRCL